MPGQAKKKTAKRRGRKTKRVKTTAKKSAGSKSALSKTGKSAPSAPKPKRRSTRRELSERREVVKRLYIVRKWTAPLIAEKLNPKYGVGLETIKDDIKKIRQEFRDAKKNGEGKLDDIINQIAAGNDERIQRLWNEYEKVVESEQHSQLELDRLETVSYTHLTLPTN